MWTRIKYSIVAVLAFPIVLFVNFIDAFMIALEDVIEARESCIMRRDNLSRPAKSKEKTNAN